MHHARFQSTLCLWANHWRWSASIYFHYVSAMKILIFYLLYILTNFRPKSLDKAREIASHPVTYVNLNGTLYKSSAPCLFPARCDGVEHFLLKLSPKLPDFEIVVNNNDWPFVNRYNFQFPEPDFFCKLIAVLVLLCIGNT